MAIWCDDKYLRLLSSQLDHFKQKGQRVYNFRCPFCNDSAVSRTKARGYVFPKQQMLMFKCHNCGIALPFGAFLKRLSRPLFDEYIMESFGRNTAETTAEPAHVRSFVRFTDYREVIQLSADTLPTTLHDVRLYVRNRQLPESALKRLYATAHARTWLAPLVGEEKAARVHDDVPYLVIPLRMPDKTWYGAQLRAVNEKHYYTFRWGHDSFRVFGLDAWNAHAPTFIVEGPLDALCVPNALACCGSDFRGAIDTLTDAGYRIEPRVLIWDNEPRNKEITKKIYTAIRDGESVVIWRQHYPKDINDMVRAGLDVPALIHQHTYRGLTAELEFQTWVKVKS